MGTHYSLSLLVGLNTHKPFYFPNAVTPSLWLKISSLALCLSYYKCPRNFSREIVVLFSSLLRKGSFKVQYLLNCLKNSHSKNYGPDDLWTDGQADHNLSKLKNSAIYIFSALVFYHSISRIRFFLVGVQKYQPIIWADRFLLPQIRWMHLREFIVSISGDGTSLPGSHLWIQTVHSLSQPEIPH